MNVKADNARNEDANKRVKKLMFCVVGAISEIDGGEQDRSIGIFTT